MVESIRRCRESLGFGEYERLSLELKELALLYRAATSAFRYAAAFDRESYVGAVRPSMMPPRLPEGFSGTLNFLHTEMKHALQGLQKEIVPILEVPGNGWLGEAWQELLQAKSENLRNHGLVCNRLVPGGRSLLREYYANKQEGGTNQ
jgi:hypothetical protein